MGCNCTKKKLVPTGKKVVKRQTPSTQSKSIVRPTRRIIKRTTR